MGPARRHRHKLNESNPRDYISAKRRERRLFITGIADGMTLSSRACVMRNLSEAREARLPALHAYVTQAVRDSHWCRMWNAGEALRMSKQRGSYLP